MDTECWSFDNCLMSAGGTVGGLQRRCRHAHHYPCWYGHDIERLWGVAQEGGVCGEWEEKS